ncbi:MAG: hypothetical protein JRF15_14890 [Deltaproteobacteria bacterium]|jgi:hypothetical protein|nr:hypothetical protein [Deltaproteobacteria bacterium]
MSTQRRSIREPGITRWRLPLAIAAMGLIAASVSYAGPTPPTPTPTPTPFPGYCDFFCGVDKKCSVGNGEPQDACTIDAKGDWVTYHYQLDLAGGPVEVWDDKLGLVGISSGGTLTQTVKIRETTTNKTWLTASDEYCGCLSCYCFDGYGDSLTVTVPTPTPGPTPTPSQCPTNWPETRIVTTAKGQSPTNNAKVTHEIVGHIVDPSALSNSAHRIQVCAGTRVTSFVRDASGIRPTNTALGNLRCTPGACWGIVDVVEKYRSVSTDGQDTDSIAFVPK